MGAYITFLAALALLVGGGIILILNGYWPLGLLLFLLAGGVRVKSW